MIGLQGEYTFVLEDDANMCKPFFMITKTINRILYYPYECPFLLLSNLFLLSKQPNVESHRSINNYAHVTEKNANQVMPLIT